MNKWLVIFLSIILINMPIRKILANSANKFTKEYFLNAEQNRNADYSASPELMSFTANNEGTHYNIDKDLVKGFNLGHGSQNKAFQDRFLRETAGKSAAEKRRWVDQNKSAEMARHYNEEVLPYLKKQDYYKDLSKNQIDALADQIYQRGAGAWLKDEKLQTALNNRDWITAANYLDTGTERSGKNKKLAESLGVRTNKRREMFLGMPYQDVVAAQNFPRTIQYSGNTATPGINYDKEREENKRVDEWMAKNIMTDSKKIEEEPNIITEAANNRNRSNNDFINNILESIQSPFDTNKQTISKASPQTPTRKQKSPTPYPQYTAAIFPQVGRVTPSSKIIRERLAGKQ